MSNDERTERVEFGWKGLKDAIGRASAKSMRAGFFRNNVFISQFKSGVIDQTRDGVDIARQTRDALKGYQHRYESGESSIEYDVDDETFARLVRNAQVSWCLYAVLCLVGVFVISTVNGAQAWMLAVNRVICGLAVSLYGLALMVRSARDFAVMSRKQALPLRVFLANLDQYWCPFPRNHWVRNAFVYGAIPFTVLIFIVLPFLESLATALGFE